MGLFGCGRAVIALTTGLPLPINSATIVRDGGDPEAIRPGELVSAYAKLGWRMSAVAWWSKRCTANGGDMVAGDAGDRARDAVRRAGRESGEGRVPLDRPAPRQVADSRRSRIAGGRSCRSGR
jgi:hypothetical protein